MHRSWILAVPVAVLTFAGAARAQDAAADAKAWQPYRSIKVLYAGWEGGSREAAFRQFLGTWFDQVGTIGCEQLSMATAADYDVVIADWASQYGNDGYPKRENSLYGVQNTLGPEFTKPVIAMDYLSSNLRSGYKLDWL